MIPLSSRWQWQLSCQTELHQTWQFSFQWEGVERRFGVEGEHHTPTLSGEKTACARMLLTARWTPEYSMQQLQRFMGIECYPIAKTWFYSYKPGDIGRLEVGKFVATTQVVQEIEAWTTSDDAD